MINNFYFKNRQYVPLTQANIFQTTGSQKSLPNNQVTDMNNFSNKKKMLT